MLSDALPQLIETLLRLPLLEAAQLRELIQHLPDPQAAAQEMVRRGWITQDQFSSLFPGPQQPPTPRETMLRGFGEKIPPDADGEDWSLTVRDADKADVPPDVERTQPDRTEEELSLEPETVEAVPDRTDEEMWRDADCKKWDLILSDEEAKTDVPPEVERAQPDRTEEELSLEPDCDSWDLMLGDDDDKADAPPEAGWPRPDRTDQETWPEPETVGAGPVLSGAASTPQFESDVLVPPVAGGNEARRRDSDTDKFLRMWMRRASKGLLMWLLFLGSWFVGVQFFGANSTVPPVTGQEFREARAGDLARVVDLPPEPPVVAVNNANQGDELLNGPGQNAPLAAPVAGPVPASEGGAQWPPKSPLVEPVDPFQQQVFPQILTPQQQILASQMQIRETAKQNTQAAQQFQQRVHLEMMQTQQHMMQMQHQMMQSHPATMHPHQTHTMRVRR
jgi:hypothetical protein